MEKVQTLFELLLDSDRNDCEDYSCNSLLVARKLIYEPDQVAAELTKEYLSFVGELLWVTYFWDQAKFDEKGISFEEFLREEIIVQAKKHHVMPAG